MQNINVNDIFPDRISQNNTENIVKSTNHTDTKKVEKASENFTLRNIDIQNPTYNQNEVKTVADQLESQLSNGQSELERKNSLVLATSGMTEQDFSKMKEDGFSPEEMEDEQIVTVADKIKIQLAKGGMDVSTMGGISDAALEDLEISEGTAKYLIKNNLEATPENIYKANHSISDKYDYSGQDSGVKEISEETLKEMLPQIERIIKDAGYAVNDESIESAKWLLSRQLPLTPENLQQYTNIINGNINTYESIGDKAKSIVDKIDSITNTQIENTVKNNDPMTIASVSSQNIQPIDDSPIEPGSVAEYELISFRRAMEEIRLSMTYEVSFSMSLRGINIDTKPLSDLVEELKAEETRLYEKLFGDDVEGVNKSLTFQERISIYEETNSTLGLLKEAPLVSLGRFSVATEITLRSLSNESKSVSAQIKAAGETYEALMTAPRKDMGDSIKKAFRNVGDILTDLGFEENESNAKAVRILGYNSLEITKESILRMKDANEQLQRVFKNLTPGVVCEMVKKGENPLDLSLDELNKKINEIKIDNPYTADDEKYAEFLYKLDRQNGLSEEERNSFVGIYRLIHQVVESDGAVIGALLNQGADITMRNMMMAIRSDKHKNREAVIDDSFGEISSFKKDSLSITQQIEMAFQTNRMRDAKEEITPSKLATFENEDSFMNMTPDEFATSLENIDENVDDEKAFENYQRSRLEQAVQSETKVYEKLRQFDLPVSPANLRAMENFLSDRNNVYRKVFSRTVTEEDLGKSPDELMADIFRRFGEAVKTPKDMADAQEKLAETAENVMNDMLVEQEVDHIDIRGMRVALKQIKMLGQIAERSENYTIPIMVADENGTINLKVVRGSNDENGLVDIAFNMDKTGPVNATFKASAQGVNGSITAVRDQILNILEENSQNISETIEESLGLQVSMEFNRNTSLSEEDIYEDKDPDFETTNERSDISTEKLYGIAKAFIDILGNLNL